MKQPKIVLLIFVSGKIVLTGAKVIHPFIFVVLFNGFIFFLSMQVDFFLLFLILIQVRDETYTAFENIYPVLTEYRRLL